MVDATGAGSAGLLTLRVRQVRYEGVGIHSYELVAPDGSALPPFTAGAHIDVHITPQLVRQYSLCNDPAERHRYVIAVLRDDAGRGGSKALHERLQVPNLVDVSAPRNNFALADGDVTGAILLAGGIGVTPLKAMAHQLARDGVPYEFHYCTKLPSHAAFGAELDGFADAGSPHRRHQRHHDGGNPADGLDIAALLRDVRPGTHVYYCGPAGFMTACAAATAHWPPGTVHSEHFKAPAVERTAAADDTGGFDVRLASSGQVVRVTPDQSIVEALAGIGVEVPTSCQSGLCGSCKTHYLAGAVVHNDCILSDSERAEYMTPCVSRAQSGVLVLDL